MKSLLFAALGLALLGSGCGGDSEAEDGDRRDVVAAFYPLAFAAEELGGADLRVRNLTPPGTEPHDVELSARDVERVREADVVLYLGSGFQPALEDAARDARGTQVDLLRGLSLRGNDPHVWLDPVRYAQVVRRIGATLGHEEKAAELGGRLTALDAEFRRGLASCERHELVTSHEAFGYLADRYGLEQVGIVGLEPEAEPSATELEDVVELVRERGVTTIFFETLVSPRLADTVARETGASTDVLNPLEGLTPEEVERGDDYFSVMRSNLAALRQALSCR
jgi:zinc transport system substrate-binding protein